MRYMSLQERLREALGAAGIRELEDSEDAIEAQCPTPEAIAAREQVVATRGQKMEYLIRQPRVNGDMHYPLDPVPFNVSYVE